MWSLLRGENTGTKKKIPNSFAQTANARARFKTDLRFPEIPQPHYQHLDHLHQLHHFDTLF